MVRLAAPYRHVHAGCPRLVEILLRKRADLRAQNKQGKTPVDVATGEAKPLLEQKLAEAAAAAAEPGAEPDSVEAAAAAEPCAEAAVVAEDAAAAEPAGSKRSVAEAADAAADAKRPKVNLTFYDGEDE